MVEDRKFKPLVVILSIAACLVALGVVASCIGERATFSCPASFAGCDGQCVDTAKDRDHCGACGNECGRGLDCTGGECTCGGAACAEGEGCCSGSCVDLESDAEHCGRCNNDCGPLGGDTCTAGDCTCGGGDLCADDLGGGAECLPGFSEICCAGGCVAVNEDNCGACGEVCDDGVPCFVDIIGGGGECTCGGFGGF